MKKVVIGLSGGVDSSVAAFLLKEAGYDVIGLFMKNWHDDSVTISNECPWLEDSNDAMIVAENLDIPFQTVDLSKEYEERIVKYMFSEYESGRTPNPDILCNREIKFDVFLKIAKGLGADYIATGHYCKKGEELINNKTIYKLLPARDSNKDQSYFLCQLTQSQLSSIIFPLQDLNKNEVRLIAKKIGLINADKKDSQGLCFIGKVKLPDFLKKRLKPNKGDIIEISASHEKFSNIDDKKFTYLPSDGKLIGNHQGAYYFTKGQRKGLSVGGNEYPLFVLETDVINNIIYVGQGKNHPGLFSSSLLISNKDEHWLRSDLSLGINEILEVDARIRYRQPLQRATLFKDSNGLIVRFLNPQSAVAAGQFVAWYINGELIGSGVIS